MEKNIIKLKCSSKVKAVPSPVLVGKNKVEEKLVRKLTKGKVSH